VLKRDRSDKRGESEWAWIGLNNSKSWVKECHVLRQVFYTNGLSGTVHTKGTLNGKETFQNAGILSPAGLNLTWDNDDTFRIVGPNDVPFGAWAQAAA
jgi:hypothetical protein